MRTVVATRIRCDRWSLPVLVATGFARRLIGLRRSPRGVGLLIRTRSVHGFGMRRPLLVIALDDEYTVLGSKVLSPNRVVTFPRAWLMVEAPAHLEPPPPGERMVVEHG